MRRAFVILCLLASGAVAAPRVRSHGRPVTQDREAVSRAESVRRKRLLVRIPVAGGNCTKISVESLGRTIMHVSCGSDVLFDKGKWRLDCRNERDRCLHVKDELAAFFTSLNPTDQVIFIGTVDRQPFTKPTEFLLSQDIRAPKRYPDGRTAEHWKANLQLSQRRAESIRDLVKEANSKKAHSSPKSMYVLGVGESYYAATIHVGCPLYGPNAKRCWKRNADQASARRVEIFVEQELSNVHQRVDCTIPEDVLACLEDAAASSTLEPEPLRQIGPAPVQRSCWLGDYPAEQAGPLLAFALAELGLDEDRDLCDPTAEAKR